MAVDFLGTLGAGSGLDSKNLVESLVAAERAPAESRLNNKISNSEQQISAYGTVLSSLQLLESAFKGLNDVSDFSNFSTTVNDGLTASGASSFDFAIGEGAEAGRHEISVTSLAVADRWVSGSGFSGTDSELNGGSAFSVTIDFEDAEVESVVVAVETATPQGLVDSINASTAGIDAVLIDTGDESTPYKIVLTGEVGADNAFTVTTDISTGTAVTFPTHTSDAADANLTLDGLTVTRSTNTIDDLIAGATINLYGISASSGIVQIAANTDVVENRIRDFVDTFNTVRTVFNTLRNPDADDPLAGALSGDNSFRLIETRLRQMVSSASSTPGDSLSYLSDIGVGMTRSGMLEINEARLSQALSSNYADLTTMLSADTESQSMSGDLSRGIAGDALFSLNELMASDGPISTRTRLAEERIVDYEADLADLDLRMKAIYDRYIKQFTAMESIVDQMNSTRDFLEQQIDALPFNNRNN
jgi:flagellar hook-associated protein 2